MTNWQCEPSKRNGIAEWEKTKLVSESWQRFCGIALPVPSGDI